MKPQYRWFPIQFVLFLIFCSVTQAFPVRIEPSDYLPGIRLGFERTNLEKVVSITRADKFPAGSDQKDRTTRLEFDFQGRLVSESVDQRVVLLPAQSYFEKASSLHYSYFGLSDRITRIALKQGSSQLGELVFIYDLVGDLIEIKSVNRAQIETARTMIHSLGNRTVIAATPGEPENTRFYEFVGGKCVRHVNFDANELSSGLVLYQYDSRGLLLRAEVFDLKSLKSLVEYYTYEYSLDMHGNWTKRTRYRWTDEHSVWASEEDQVSTRKIVYR